MAMAPGPVPKRTEQRVGAISPHKKARKVERGQPTVCPAADDDWHDKAKDWYDSLSESGQSEFYEPSDWAYARVLAQMTSDLLNQSAKRGYGSSELLKAIQSGMDSLGVTEGARRRMRVEVDRPDPNAGKVDQAKVTAMSTHRRKAAAASG